MEGKRVRITEESANFVSAARYDDFSSEVLRIAKRCILDGFGVMLAGSTEP